MPRKKVKSKKQNIHIQLNQRKKNSGKILPKKI